MKKELDEKLVKDFPDLYRDRNAPMTQTALCWGFEIGDGWFNIVYELSEFIQSRLANFNEELMREYRYNNHLDYEYTLTDKEKTKIGVGKFNIIVDQVKEKYGTLRFYYHGEIDDDSMYDERQKQRLTSICDEIMGAEEMACRASSIICEICGNRGKLIGGGWVATLCKEHAKENYADYDWDKGEFNFE